MGEYIIPAAAGIVVALIEAVAAAGRHRDKQEREAADQPDHKDPKDLKDYKEYKAKPGRKDRLENKVHRGEQGPQGIQGEMGPAGADGTSATITIGTVATGDPGTNATVTNTGDTTNAVFNFSIPRGDVGERGPGVRANMLDNWCFVGGCSQLGYGVFPINQRGQTS